MKIAIAALLLFACERERRTFEDVAPSARPLTATPMSSNHPGKTSPEGAPLDPKLPGYLENAFTISEGKQLYGYFNCSGCHAHGGGAIGPALMDKQWRYGSRPADIALSIIAGRPFGMPAYRGKIASSQLYAIVAYVRALGGLARYDALPARDEHMSLTPAGPLDDYAIPHGAKETP
jgi:cytochrome c oxidase cbb3-type subunit III